MRYVIVGAGAVGGVIGGRLFAAGHDVVLVARGDHLAALRAHGLELQTPDGTERHPVPAVARPVDAGLRPDDVVVLATKSQDTAAAVADLAITAPPEVALVCAQNGVANERTALRSFRHVYAQCVVLPAGHLEPGIVIQDAGPCPGILDLGRYPTGVDERTGAIAADFEAAGFRSAVDAHVMRKKYRKLLVNLANALDALCGPSSRGSDLARRASDEGAACLAAAGIEVQPVDEERRWRGEVRIRAEPSVARGSSTWQSLARGTGTVEVDWLNGEIVLLGRMHGVPTPVNELLQREANAAARQHLAPRSTTVEALEQKLVGTGSA